MGAYKFLIPWPHGDSIRIFIVRMNKSREKKTFRWLIIQSVWSHLYQPVCGFLLEDIESNRNCINFFENMHRKWLMWKYANDVNGKFSIKLKIKRKRSKRSNRRQQQQHQNKKQSPRTSKNVLRPAELMIIHYADWKTIYRPVIKRYICKCHTIN